MSKLYGPLKNLDGPNLTNDLVEVLHNGQTEIGTYDPAMLTGMMMQPIGKLLDLAQSRPGNAATANVMRTIYEGVATLGAGLKTVVADAVFYAAQLTMPQATAALRPARAYAPTPTKPGARPS